jgi:hypothetical protein
VRAACRRAPLHGVGAPDGLGQLRSQSYSTAAVALTRRDPRAAVRAAQRSAAQLGEHERGAAHGAAAADRESEGGGRAGRRKAQGAVTIVCSECDVSAEPAAACDRCARACGYYSACDMCACGA